MTALEIVERLGLQPLEGEGGMFVSTYTSLREVNSASIGSAIFYLLHADCFSHFHKLAGDEIWYWHGGSPLELTELCQDGSVRTTTLGMELANGQVPQHVVKAGNWMGACRADDDAFDYTLVSTSNHPGYVDGCYTHGVREELLRQYPQAEEKILRLTGYSKPF